MNVSYILILALAIIALPSCTNPKQYTQQSKNSFEQDSVISINTNNSVQSASPLSQKWFMSLEEALESPDSVYNLSLREKGYQVFPKEILRFEKLKKLDISMNNFEELPMEIGQMSNLEYFTSAYGKLKFLPESIGSMKKLMGLNLLYNEIDFLPNSIGELDSLKSLNLNGNNISSIPESMYNLQSLEELYLGQSKKKTLFNKKDQFLIRSKLPKCQIYF